MRDDIGNNLVHLSKGVGNDPSKHRAEAAKNLVLILRERSLRGGMGFIKGKHVCVCFSEAPISKLSHILAANDPAGFKYQPYGVLVGKKWLFNKGGRPAIYGPDTDYEKLPDEMRYRHVRFWLSDQYSVDHTWEREWRIKADSLPITPDEVTIVVPDRAAKEAFSKHGFAEWHYIVLSDLGVEVPPL